MKTNIIIAILATALIVHADDKTPVVVPVQGCGTSTTSKFGDGYFSASSACLITQKTH